MMIVEVEMNRIIIKPQKDGWGCYPIKPSFPLLILKGKLDYGIFTCMDADNDHIHRFVGEQPHPYIL